MHRVGIRVLGDQDSFPGGGDWLVALSENVWCRMLHLGCKLTTMALLRQALQPVSASVLNVWCTVVVVCFQLHVLAPLDCLLTACPDYGSSLCRWPYRGERCTALATGV